MVPPLAPNRIHSLPVQVSYHVQASSQTFSALFPTLQQVYVHPNAGASKVDGHDEAWGAIYLKAVVQGIALASPELHPRHPGTPDLSLYVLDPRETFLRRSRASDNVPPHLRTSPTGGSHEVWTGKGLMSWALDEPGAGKNLITGRLVRRREFSTVFCEPTEGMSALEALAAADSKEDNQDGWGIEISVGLKSSISAAVGFPGPLHQSIERGEVAGVAFTAQPKPTPVPESPVPKPLASRFPFSRNPSSSIPPVHQASRPTASSSRAPPTPAQAKPAPPKGKGKAGRKKKPLSEVDTNRGAPSSDATFPSDIPAEIYAKPETMTREQAQRLLANPSFISILESLTGAPIRLTAEKRAAVDAAAGDAKRARVEEPPRPYNTRPAPAKRIPPTAEEMRCWNCRITKSSVWRSKQNADGEMVRVCNACGLYYNKTRCMRPPSMWQNSSEDALAKRRPPRGQEARKDKAEDTPNSRTFKRTLTQVVNKDAERIAELRNRKPTPNPSKAGPMTSPARGPALGRGVRNAAFDTMTTIAASSPGGWANEPESSAGAASRVSPETPGTALRRLLGDSMPSLAMPLSDDDAGSHANPLDWNDDISAFFDVDGFAGDVKSEPRSADPSPPKTSTADIQGVSSATRARKHIPTSDANLPPESEDDVFSQLFNRTSSFGQFESSPTPFDFSQLPPSSPPAIPSNLPHSALLFSSPSGSPLDPSPRDSEGGKPSPAQSGLRNEVTADACTAEEEKAIQDLFAKLSQTNMSEDLMALFNNFPASTV